MARVLVLLMGVNYVILSVYIFAAPQHFYDTIPGVAMMGPFNLHFIRDAGLAFLATGGALLWGGWNYVRSTAMAGAAFVCLHALFHIQIWIARGAPFDIVTWTNLFLIQAPAWLALYGALKLRAPRLQG